LMLLWGVDYLAYFDVVVMLCIGQSALMVFSLASHILFLSDKQIINTVSETTCFILNIILNILLIPKYGALGAALGTTISFTILSIIKFLAVLQYFSDMNRKIIT
jgi:O-antigen/teichoic acid export membrane protein